MLDTANSEPELALNSGKRLKGPWSSCDGTFNHRHVRLPIMVDESGPTLGDIIIIAHLVALSSVFVWLMLNVSVCVGMVRSPNHTFFLGKLDLAGKQYFMHILSLVTLNNLSLNQKKGAEWP